MEGRWRRAFKAALALAAVSLVLSSCDATASEALQVYPDGHASVTLRVVGPAAVTKAANDSMTAAMRKLSELKGLPAGVEVSVKRVQEGSSEGIETTWSAKSVQDAIAVLELVSNSQGGVLSDAKWSEKNTIVSHSRLFSAKLNGSNLEKAIKNAGNDPDLSGLDWNSLSRLRVEFSVTAPEPVVSAPGAKVTGRTATWTVEPGRDVAIFVESSEQGPDWKLPAAAALLVLIALTVYVAVRMARSKDRAGKQS